MNTNCLLFPRYIISILPSNLVTTKSAQLNYEDVFASTLKGGPKVQAKMPCSKEETNLIYYNMTLSVFVDPSSLQYFTNQLVWEQI